MEPSSNSLISIVGPEWVNSCLNNLNDMILITEGDPVADLGYKIVWANDVFYRFTGYSESEVIGNTPTMLQGPLTDLAEHSELKKALRNWQSCRIETINYKKDGTLFWNEFEINPISDETGYFTHWISIQRDITDRKRLEETISQSAERYELALEGANVGLWDWNIITNEVFYSTVWRTMLGYQQHEIKNELSEWKQLLHPEDAERAISKAQAFINNKSDKYEFEFRLRHKDGHYVDIQSNAFALSDEHGKINRLIGTHVDITSRKKSEGELIYQSNHDNLTGLINRREFERRAGDLLKSLKRNESQHALCYIDLDQFKIVNDTSGHIAGDELLRRLSGIMQNVIRENDSLARLGGDEFGILIENCSIQNAHRVAVAIQNAVEDFQFIWEGRSFRISTSIGLVPIDSPDQTLTDLLKDADAACYMAKELGRNRVQVYYHDDIEISHRITEMQWVNRIQQALNEDLFCLYAQKIQSINQSHSSHYEVLIRMLGEKGEIIAPNTFLPAAERYHLISKLDKWVIENVFNILESNTNFLGDLDFISINLSGQSIGDKSFLNFILEKFKKSNINGNNVCFEITETAAISNIDKANEFISALKEVGCHFALDDFGTGLSSFGYLKKLPVDFLKIDGLFVKDIVEDKIDRAMVRSINEVGHIMGMQTIAEFVENDEIKAILEQIGVDYVQGYGIHKPESLDEIFQATGLHIA